MAEVLASAKGAPAPNLAVTPAFWAGRAAGHPAYPPEAGKAEPAAAAAAAGGEASAAYPAGGGPPTPAQAPAGLPSAPGSGQSGLSLPGSSPEDQEPVPPAPAVPTRPLPPAPPPAPALPPAPPPAPPPPPGAAQPWGNPHTGARVVVCAHLLPAQLPAARAGPRHPQRSRPPVRARLAAPHQALAPNRLPRALPLTLRPCRAALQVRCQQGRSPGGLAARGASLQAQAQPRARAQAAAAAPGAGQKPGSARRRAQALAQRRALAVPRAALARAAQVSQALVRSRPQAAQLRHRCRPPAQLTKADGASNTRAEVIGGRHSVHEQTRVRSHLAESAGDCRAGWAAAKWKSSRASARAG